MENQGKKAGNMPNNPDILDAIRNAAEDFQLASPATPPTPGRAEEEVLGKVLTRIIEQNRRRATRHSKEGILQCFTYKVPAHELQEIGRASCRERV